MVYTYTCMFSWELCVWRAPWAPRPQLQGLIMGNAHASASWFDVLSWPISIYRDKFVLKLCMECHMGNVHRPRLKWFDVLPWHPSWAMCRFRLHGLMFCHGLNVYIYICVCVYWSCVYGVLHGQCAGLSFTVWCSAMSYKYMYWGCVWSASWPMLRPQLHGLVFYDGLLDFIFDKAKWDWPGC